MQKPQIPANKEDLVPQLTRDRYFESSYAYHLEASDSSGLLEYWQIFCRHKRALLLITLLGGLAGILVSLPQTPIYRARATLEIQDLNENFLNFQQINPVSEGNSNTATTGLQTQIKLLQSESLIKRVLLKLRDRIPGDLKTSNPSAAWSGHVVRATTGWFAAGRKEALDLAEKAGLVSSPEPNLSQGRSLDQVGKPTSKPQRGSEPETLDHVDLVRAAKSLDIRGTPQTRIVQAAYDSSDPHFAAAFLNTLAQEFVESNMEARGEMSEQTGKWLSRQLDDMRLNLQRSEDALQSYARRAGLMYTSDKTTVSEEKLRQLQEELSKAHADRATTQSRWEMSKTSPPDALPDVLSDISLRALEDKLTDLRRQRAELITTYTENHSKVKRVEAQIAPLEAALQKQRSAIIDRLRNDYQAARRRESLLTSDYGTQSLLVTEQAQKSVQYNILKREVDSNRQLYEVMLQRVKEASVAAAMRASNVRIVDPAEPPKLPHHPSFPLNGALGLLSGLFISAAFVIMRERADRTLRAPGEARFWLNIPELQVIPKATQELGGRILYTDKHNRTTTLSPYVIGLTSGAPVLDSSSVELVTWHQKPSLIADSFRSLLTSILLCGEDGHRPRVLVVTSASPEEGKTTVVSNLGIALAEIKRKVLIIDADLRKPRIHQIFGLSNSHGLGSLLDGRPLPNVLDGVVRQTNIPGLFVLPSGLATESAPNLLYSENFSRLLAIFKQEFDMVIIDTPPMLHMPDARIVGRMADGVVLVTRAGHTKRDAVAAANQRFAQDRIRILGTILNDWDPRKAGQDYYRYGTTTYGAA